MTQQRTAARAPLEVRIGRAAVVAFSIFLMSRTYAHYLQDPPVRAALAVVLATAVIGLYATASFRPGRRRRWILGAMVLLAYLPLPILGEWWAAAGVFLAAMTLVFLPRPWALPSFALVVVVEGGKSLALGDDLPSAVTWIMTVVISSIPLVALTRFAEMARVLYETRAELVAVEVAAQRARAMRELEGILGSRLDTIAVLGREILTGADGDAETLKKELRGMLAVAREAQREMREFAHREQRLTRHAT
ncbi:hypothetical protein [Herbidospora yilanensis]|uniref:hypothetical protein n=1 Tax=Herbidospora yilanensis TaxID=354426 RepID=UPI000A87B748|nr:hypothetical protein [Herbidospora yilanensis]